MEETKKKKMKLKKGEIAILINEDEIKIKGFDIPDDKPNCFWEGHIKNRVITLQKMIPSGEVEFIIKKK